MSQLTLLPEFLGHVPAGTSVKTLVQFCQLRKSGRFCNYDYGPEENLQRYKSKTPPEYDLDKVNMPVILFYSSSDVLVGIKDEAKLSEKLPNLIANVKVANPLFNHMDFMWAEDAKAQVYDRILEEVMKHDV